MHSVYPRTRSITKPSNALRKSLQVSAHTTLRFGTIWVFALLNLIKKYKNASPANSATSNQTYMLKSQVTGIQTMSNAMIRRSLNALFWRQAVTRLVKWSKQRASLNSVKLKKRKNHSWRLTRSITLKQLTRCQSQHSRSMRRPHYQTGSRLTRYLAKVYLLRVL